MRLIDAALIDQVLDKLADRIFRESRNDRGVKARSSAFKPRATLYSPPPSHASK
jgi:hypothetical protein